MNNVTNEGIKVNPSTDLVLSTWFTMYLHGDRPGGLPQDFLSRGAPALFIFDKVYCDSHALDAEERSNVWLSSALFLELKKEDILKPIDMRERMSQDFLNHLEDTGITKAAIEAMETELAAIKKGEKKPRQLQLLPAITQLNHYMFMAGLDIPNSLNYEWQEHHFKVLPTKNPAFQRGASNIQYPEEKERRVREFASVMKTLLPEFSLLPPIRAGSEAGKALSRNINREKVPLYRWIYGDPDMPRNKYHEIRLGPDFRTYDAKVDELRKAEAWQNLELLLKVRNDTKNVRADIQGIISDILDGKRTIKDVEKQLEDHRKELVSHLPNRRSVTGDVALAGVGALVTLAESLLTFFGITSVPTPVGPSLGLTGIYKAIAKRRNYRELRKKYPLAWFLLDFEHIRTIQQVKLTPRRRRK